MALKITQSPTFRWPVTIKLPADGGRHDSHTFDLEFQRVRVSDAKRMADQASEAIDLVCEVVKGWSGVIDDNGPVPFSETALRQVLDLPGVAATIWGTFLEATAGAAREKN